MKLNIDKSSSKHGLIRKREIHSAKITVVLDEEEKQAMLDFYNPKDPSTDGDLITYENVFGKVPLKVRFGWIVNSVKKGEDFSWTFNAHTAIDREALIQEFVEELKHVKEIFMTNAKVSGDGTSEIEI